MTDPIVTSAPSHDQAFVDTLVFEKKGIWLPQLAVHHFNAGKPTIEGKTFRNCLIEGPAILAALEGVEFDGCNMGLAEDPRSLLVQAVGPRLMGVIPFANTRFIDCRFFMVGFTGAPDFLAAFEQTLVSARARETAATDAAS